MLDGLHPWARIAVKQVGCSPSWLILMCCRREKYCWWLRETGSAPHRGLQWLHSGSEWSRCIGHGISVWKACWGCHKCLGVLLFPKVSAAVCSQGSPITEEQSCECLSSGAVYAWGTWGPSLQENVLTSLFVGFCNGVFSCLWCVCIGLLSKGACLLVFKWESYKNCNHKCQRLSV